MKIITLNTWGGYAGKDGLLNFFKKYKDEVDIFCLQEVWGGKNLDINNDLAGSKFTEKEKIMSNGKKEISAILDNYIDYFRPHLVDDYGLLTLVHKKYQVINEGEIFVYKEKGYVSDQNIGDHARNIQYLNLNIDNSQMNIINFHGLWTGKGKTDTEDRLNQSKNIINFLSSLTGRNILCGDFNLRPDTESIKILEDFGLKNLIKEYKIESTRTHFYNKSEKFADYIFISPEIAIKDFQVLPDVVSDHSPLLIEI